ncbi:MAG: hypothetical protein AAF942_02960 [Pseudomonadota bacterium]
MPVTSKYLFVVSMDVTPEKEDLFNEVYDTEHVPNLLKVPGVLSVVRMHREPLTLAIGGERKAVTYENEPAYTAIYEIESPDILVSDAWAEAVEDGRWPDEVRPHTSNRRHTLHRISG